jgi:acyl-CoA reductase-like NAD-dependent aldehyde dehydrogenase
MKILQEEIFAPVLPVMTYDNLDQVISTSRRATSRWRSTSSATTRTTFRRCSTGPRRRRDRQRVFSHYLENRLPFGGVNGSGMGSYHGHFGFKAFSHERAGLPAHGSRLTDRARAGRRRAAMRIRGTTRCNETVHLGCGCRAA